MATPLKFLHSSDWHLDRPLSGLSGIPDHLRETLVEAPWQAAANLFDRALAEQVDFLLLSGDIVDLEQGGPRAVAFLMSRFERLAERGIHVYWCSGSVDHPDRLPGPVCWPDNVTLFVAAGMAAVVHCDGDRPVATICGCGRQAKKRSGQDFSCEPDAVFPIALAHGELEAGGLASSNIRYWALGGKHQRTVAASSGAPVIYPGTPQARDPGQSGKHSCTLVTVSADGKPETAELEVDTVRWLSPRLTVSENASADDLRASLADRCLRIQSQTADRLTLVNWEIATSGKFNPQLRDGQAQASLLAWLREEFGKSTTGLWTGQLTIEPPVSLPAEWQEEDTILGDYLRALGPLQADPASGLALDRWLGPRAGRDEVLSELVRIPAATREAILRQVALTGIEYLAGRDSGGSAETTGPGQPVA